MPVVVTDNGVLGHTITNVVGEEEGGTVNSVQGRLVHVDVFRLDISGIFVMAPGGEKNIYTSLPRGEKRGTNL